MTPPGAGVPGGRARDGAVHEMQSKSGFKFGEASGFVKCFEVISEV